MIGIKICGITNPKDAKEAVEAGANALGFILAPSPRRVNFETVETISRNLPPFVLKVGVVTPQTEVGWEDLLSKGLIDLVQVHGEINLSVSIPRARVIRAVSVGDGKMESVSKDLMGKGFRALLLDTFKAGHYGGTGASFNWEKAESFMRLKLPVILAGGLRPDNIREALDAVGPAGVDVSSGVEISPGRKDRIKMRDFISEVRSWEMKKRGNRDVPR